MNTRLVYWTIYCGPNNGNGYTVGPKPSEVYDCYFFSNNENILEVAKQNGYKTKALPLNIENDIRKDCWQSRIYKIQSHKLKELDNYDYNCYYDSKRNINTSLIEQFIDYNVDKVMAIRRHPHQFNVFEDFTVSMLQERYRKDSEIYAQMLKENCGVPGLRLRNEHVENSVIVRKKCMESTEINNYWYGMCEKYCGVQDQLSSGIVFHKYRNRMELLDKRCSN